MDVNTHIEKVDSLLRRFNIRLDWNEEELKYLPKGPYVAVAKHLFGEIDHLMMLKLLGTKSAQVKMVTSEQNWVTRQLREMIFPVELNDADDDLFSQLKQFDIQAYLEEGGALGVFPARHGKIFSTQEGKIIDRKWEPPVIRMVRDLRIPIIPISFHSRENRFLSFLKFNNPEYGAAELLARFTEKENVVTVRIGQAISVKDQDYFVNNSRLGRFLRAKTNVLGTKLEVTQFYNPFRRIENVQDIAPAVSKEIIEEEMEKLRERGGLLLTQNEFEIYIARTSLIPNVMMEIGRLREITFREVGEGTNKPRDVDEYDLYYEQLIIWDKDAKQIAGGYRIGKGDEIYKAYGIKGFYISSLFKIDKGFGIYLSKAVELGRSYIIGEYQKKRLPLFLLWKGIVEFLSRNPQYRYLIGPLSISNQYSNVSRHLMIEFIKRHYFDYRLAKYISPRKPYKVKMKDVDTEILIQTMDGEIAKLDDIVEEIEPGHFRLPVLMKKYIKQNARIISFNVDPNFSDVLDGLMILDLHDVPDETIENLKKEK
ncbi:MAG: GNAT family N-acyltransferase [Chitinophagales bacterium]|nr:GNAT family N-acyltransferase [Chitinophagales bacterium]